MPPDLAIDVRHILPVSLTFLEQTLSVAAVGRNQSVAGQQKLNPVRRSTGPPVRHYAGPPYRRSASLLVRRSTGLSVRRSVRRSTGLPVPRSVSSPVGGG